MMTMRISYRGMSLSISSGDLGVVSVIFHKVNYNDLGAERKSVLPVGSIVPWLEHPHLRCFLLPRDESVNAIE